MRMPLPVNHLCIRVQMYYTFDLNYEAYEKEGTNILVLITEVSPISTQLFSLAYQNRKKEERNKKHSDNTDTSTSVTFDLDV